jgi:hypothetical protein
MTRQMTIHATDSIPPIKHVFFMGKTEGRPKIFNRLPQRKQYRLKGKNDWLNGMNDLPNSCGLLWIESSPYLSDRFGRFLNVQELTLFHSINGCAIRKGAWLATRLSSHP